MKLNLSSFSKILTGIRYGDRLRPLRDWFVILGVGSVLLLASVFWNGWLVYKVGQGQVIGAAATSTPTLNTGGTETVGAVFSHRAEEAARFKNEYRFVDPKRGGS